MIRYVKSLRDHVGYFAWIRRGQQIPINHVFKRMRLLRIGREFQCDTMIETGTFYGQMVEATRKAFKLVLSVELDPQLYEYNQAKFAGCRNVRLYQGDSAVQLTSMTGEIQGRGIFWLDGHGVAPNTPQNEQNCPVLAELAAISIHARNDHCILIDDARFFAPSGDYPIFDEIQARLLAINPAYHVYVDDADCIIALPPLHRRASQ